MIRILLFAATPLIAAGASIYTLPADDRAAIAAKISSFARAFVTGNTSEVINVAAVARNGGMSEQALPYEMAKLAREGCSEFKNVTAPKGTIKVIG